MVEQIGQSLEAQVENAFSTMNSFTRQDWEEAMSQIKENEDYKPHNTRTKKHCFKC